MAHHLKIATAAGLKGQKLPGGAKLKLPTTAGEPSSKNQPAQQTSRQTPGELSKIPWWEGGVGELFLLCWRHVL